jgi:hypothetical protein
LLGITPFCPKFGLAGVGVGVVVGVGVGVVVGVGVGVVVGAGVGVVVGVGVGVGVTGSPGVAGVPGVPNLGSLVLIPPVVCPYASRAVATPWNSGPRPFASPPKKPPP